MVLLLLITLITAGGAAVQLWNRRNAILAEAVQQKLEDILPTCDVKFASVRLIDSSQLEVTDLVVHAKETGARLMVTPLIVSEFDTKLFLKYRRIVTKRIIVHSPELFAVRSANGNWSWQGVSPPQPSNVASPQWVIKDGIIRVGFESAPGGETRFVTCQGIQVTLQPNAHRRYELDGQAIAEAAGPISVTGYFDGHRGDWNIRGEAGEMRLGDSLLEMTGEFVPQVQQQLATLRETNSRLRNVTTSPGSSQQIRSVIQMDDQSVVRDAADQSDPSSPNAPGSLMRAEIALAFEFGQDRHQSFVNYRISGALKHGQISELLLPIPLYDVEGRFEITRDKFQVDNLKAVNNASSLFVDGVAHRVGTSWTKDFQIQATQLQLDERIRTFLTPSLLKIYNLLNPAGKFNLDVDFKHEPNHPPLIRLRKFQALDFRVLCDAFQYPLDHVHGEITQKGEMFHVDLTGQANKTPITVKGTMQSGSGNDAHLTITGKDLPIDQTLIQAFQRPEQKSVRESLESLQPRGGVTDFQAEIIRDQRTADKYVVTIDGAVRDGSLSFTGFPYEISEFSGRYKYNPFERDAWLFEEIHGKHGNADLSGRGVVDLEADSPTLALEMTLVRIPIDHDLQQATLVANPSWESIWSDFELGGSLDVEQAQIGWRPGQPVFVRLNGMLWKDGRARPAALPYAWENITGSLTWDGNRLLIHSLQGFHDESYLQIDGTGTEGPAYVQSSVSDAIAWRFHCPDIKVVSLNPDHEFRRALPTPLSQALNAVDLKNPVDLHLSIDLKGWNSNEELVTAQWKNCLLSFRDNSLSAGFPLSNVKGRIKILNGTWNGEKVSLEGYAELETVEALDLPFTNVRGPLQMNGEQLTFGTPKFNGRDTVHSNENPYRGRQLQGDLYTGQVGLDVEVLLKDWGKDPMYQTEVSVLDIELAEWARDWKIQSQRLMGKLNANARFQGRGNSATSTTGKGWLQITPAALYELPVFAQMFSLINFRPPDNTAFTYAYADFDVHDGLFDFSRIELVGDALSLIGYGTVGYAGSQESSIDLDFYSKANNRIPFLRPFVEQFGNNWVRVQVVGTVSNPTPLIQPRFPLLDDAFRGFMQGLEKGTSNKKPPRTPPRQPSS